MKKFQYAMRLLENGQYMFSANVGRCVVSAVLYLHIKWKYVANRLMIFSRKDGVQFAAMIARLPLRNLR